MQTSATQVVATPKRVDAAGTARLIAAAAEQHLVITLESAGAVLRAIWRARITSGEGDRLVLELEDARPETLPRLKSAPLSAHFVLDDVGYSFDTRCAGFTQAKTVCSISIERPMFVNQADRRRSLRQALSGSSVVALRLPGTSTLTAAALLNLSPEGLACRVDSEWAEQLARGDAVQVYFSIGTPAQAYDMTAQLISMTPASEGCCVLGIAFGGDEGCGEIRARLAECLRRVAG